MRTNRLPSEWAAEADRDWRGVRTVLQLMRDQDDAGRRAAAEQQDED